MKNFADQGGCYPQGPKAEVDNTLRKQNSITALSFIQNISPFLKEFQFAISLFVFPLTQNNTTSSPGFLGQRFNNLLTLF